MPLVTFIWSTSNRRYHHGGLHRGGGTSHKVKKIYLGESNVARKIKKAYIGDENGKARLFFSSATIWKKYNSVESHTYHWNRFDLVTTTTYTWDKYQITYEYQLVNGSSKTVDIRNTDTVYRSAYPNRGRVELSGSVLAVSASSDLKGLSGYYYSMSGQALRLTSVNIALTTTRVRYNCVVVESKQIESQQYMGTVSSTDASAYPTNGSQDGYYYSNRRSSTSYSKGSANGSVSSTNRSQYPDNNYSGSYWYVYDRDEVSYSQGSYISDVENDDPSAYPENGRHTDGYWYVKQAE